MFLLIDFPKRVGNVPLSGCSTPVVVCGEQKKGKEEAEEEEGNEGEEEENEDEKKN